MEFGEKVNYWKELMLNDRQKAKSFYYDSLFPEIIDRFLQKSQSLSRYHFLISLLGFSPEPIILFLRAIRPQKVLFIHSEETEEYLDAIQKWTGLSLTQVIRETVNSSDPTGVYKSIKEFASGKDPKEILIDITGGKKSMVGGAAIAGNLLGIDTGYVDYSEYLSDLKQPRPGTEFPNILRNPFYVFGDIDLDKAREAFNHYDFERCLEILAELDQRIEDIWGIRKLKALAEIYKAMDVFNFLEANTLILKFLEKYERDKKFISADQIKKTADILMILNDQHHPEFHTYMCLNYYFAGERMAERARFDIGVFLMYRTIEMILSTGLVDLGIDPSNPNYPEWITVGRYNKKLKEVYEKEYYEKSLPLKIGLMDSAIILSLYGNPLLKEFNLKELKGVVELRNKSHFTHGDKVLNEEDFRRIRRLSRKLLEQYLHLKEKSPVIEFEKLFKFPKIE
ncbi:MAG: TIGR02710 family CRISPR-associated CARF protein [Thermodesulfobacteriota bacterium]